MSAPRFSGTLRSHFTYENYNVIVCTRGHNVRVCRADGQVGRPPTACAYLHRAAHSARCVYETCADDFVHSRVRICSTSFLAWPRAVTLPFMSTLEQDYKEAIESGRLKFVVVEPDPIALVEALRKFVPTPVHD